MTTTHSDVGVVGLGVMGRNLALNLLDHGFSVSGFDVSDAARDAFAAQNRDARPFPDIRAFVASLAKPRRIILLVPAGPLVDQAIAQLNPVLETGDLVVDAGNSLFRDTERRIREADGAHWMFAGMGVSGGSDGARHGPALMPGGSAEVYDALRPILEPIAARSELGPCVGHCGLGAAGHFVKMVHNGIEYGIMQLIAESVELLRLGLGLSDAAVAATLSEWNEGSLNSFLMGITADIFSVPEPNSRGLLVDRILDEAEQKGTGRWTVASALELGVAVPTISAALDARVISAQRPLRVALSGMHGFETTSLVGLTPADVGDALWASTWFSYVQGFTMLSAASQQLGLAIPLAEVARVWTGGCIIRSRLLVELYHWLKDIEPNGGTLMAHERAPDETGTRWRAARRVVEAATGAGFGVPALAASVHGFRYFLTPRTGAYIVQAQRDYFGEHTYRRIDDPDVAVHTSWPAMVPTRPASGATPGTGRT